MPLSTHQSKTIIQQLVEVVKRHPQINVAIVYGSVAAGTARDDSDVDLAVAAHVHESVGHETLLELSLQAGRATGREVQVRDLSTAQGVFLKQVLTTGVVILQRDATVRAELIIRMLDFVEDMLPNVRMIRAKARERLFAGQ